MEPHEFAGTIAPYHTDAVPHWPETPRPPAGAPNVVVVVLDDVGFAQLGCFGSDIATPRLDRLAENGLRYANFHTTALCSPTRACVLTGRNHHSAGMGRIIELATGFPGYDARIPRSVGFLPEMLTPHGYAAYAVGKWHLTPEEETHLGARRDRWPLGRGFERWYGFFGGETHQNAPALVHDSHQVTPRRSVEDGYHLTEDLVDRAIEYVVDLRHADPDKPFLLYLATGACHSPHQAPPEWIEGYRGAFDDGWDAWRERALDRQIAMGLLPEGTRLSPRPDWVPAWDDLDDTERAVNARYMEAFAGFLSHTDHHLGRLVDHLDRTGELDSTLLVRQHLGRGIRGAGRRRAGAKHRLHLGRVQALAVAHDQQPLHGVAQLPHVAGPGVRLEGRLGTGIELRRPAAVLLAPAADEMPGQQRDVLAPLAQRGQAHREDVEPVEEILSEAPRGDLDLEVAVRRRDHAHVHLDRRVLPHPPALLLLQRAVELDLHRQWQLADLVEKDRAALRLLEQPGLGTFSSPRMR
jgi:hypothetical protein